MRTTRIWGVACVLGAVLTALPAHADHGGALPQPSPTAATPETVLLVFSARPPDDASNPCESGSFHMYNVPGDHDDLTVCTYDAAGKPVATDATDHRLRWSVGDQPNDDPNVVRFNPTTPPEETTDTTATATAAIDAIQGGRTHVTVTLVDGEGATVDWFSVEKEVQGGGCGGSTESRSTSRSPQTTCRDVLTDLTATKRRSFIRGRAKTESECRPNRDVTLFLRRVGRDNVVGGDTTGDGGRWRVRTGKLAGRYYARVAAGQATDAETGATVNCIPDQSNDVRRR